MSTTETHWSIARIHAAAEECPTQCPKCGSDSVSAWAVDGKSSRADHWECDACRTGGDMRGDVWFAEAVRAFVTTASRAELLRIAMRNDPNGEWSSIAAYDAAKGIPCTCTDDETCGRCPTLANDDHDVATDEIAAQIVEWIDEARTTPAEWGGR